MQVLRVETVTELPGVCMVEAFKPVSMMDREGQMVGFYVRARHVGDRFQIAKWEDFSPRWMKFADPIPEGWEEKIREREEKLGKIAEISRAEELVTPIEKVVQIVRQATEGVALSQVGQQHDTGTINYSSGKITKTLALKK